MKSPLILILILLFVHDINAQGGWKYAHAPGTSRYEDVSFINDSIGFIVQGSSLLKTQNRGELWTSRGQIEGGVYVRSIEFLDENLGFIGSIFDANGNKGLFKTTDGGTTWVNINDKVTGGSAGVCGLDHLGNIIIGVGEYSAPGRFYISKDRGETWKSKLINQTTALVDCLTLNDSTYLISGISKTDEGTFAGIMKSSDYGETWKTVGLSKYPASYCWKLSMNKNGLGIGAIENGKTCFITHDFGETWTENNVDVDATDLLHLGGVAFLNDSVGWAARQWHPGLYETRDGGQSWTFIDFGSSINRIIVLDENNAIAVGKNVYLYNSGISGTKTETLKTKFHTMSISPNPARYDINLVINLIERTAVRLDLIDQKGKLIKELFQQPLNKGSHRLSFDCGNVNPGTYFVWMRTNEGHMAEKVIVGE